MASRSVVVVSENTLCRKGTAELLRNRGCQVNECGSIAQLVGATRARTVHAIVVDADHAPNDARTYILEATVIAGTRQLVVLATPLRLAALDLDLDITGVETPHTDASTLMAAVNGRQARQSTELARHRRIWSQITPRQREVLSWLAIGRDNRQIAHSLRIGERAVKAHVSASLEGFGVDNRTQLALLAERAGLRPRR